MNRSEIRGGLVRDPDSGFTQGGVARSTFTVAVNGTRYDSQKKQHIVKTAYIRVTAWAAVAEAVMEARLLKGDEVYVLGELDQFEVEKDGRKERKTGVVAFVVNVLRSSSSGTRTAGQSAQRTEPAADPWAG